MEKQISSSERQIWTVVTNSCFIKNDDSADDVKHVDLTQVHYLSGPIKVPTAEPGDLLKVEFLNLGPLPGDEWGFTGTFHKDNGGGFLTDHYPEASIEL